jgi:hypothetical protein
MAKDKKLKEERTTPDPELETEFSLFREKKLTAPEKPKGVMTKKDLEDSKVKFDPNIMFKKSDEEKKTTKGMRVGKGGVEFFFSKEFKKGGLVKQGKPKIAKKGWR